MIVAPEIVERERWRNARSRRRLKRRGWRRYRNSESNGWRKDGRYRRFMSDPMMVKDPILKRLHEEFLPANGLTEARHHNEIYLSDPRKTPISRLMTILRQPVRLVG